MSTARTALLALAACACAPTLDKDAPVKDVDLTDDVGIGSDDGDGADGGEDGGEDGGDGGTGDDGPAFEYDCDAPIDEVVEHQVLDWARGYHGLLFDDEGQILGWDGRNAMVHATYDGESSTWLPGISNSEQLLRAMDGGVYYMSSERSTLFHITPEGAETAVASGFYYGYGLTWGPDGNIYIADGDVQRFNPETGELTVIVSKPRDESWWSHSLGFNLDSTVLYVGTIGSGQILEIALDDNLDPVGEPEVFAWLPGGWLDAMEMDACGNLWVPDYYSSTLFRVDPEGNSTAMVDISERLYGHGVAWGNNVGGWRPDAIYQPLPYNRNEVRELVIGVPDGRTVRTWKGERFSL